MDRVEQLEAAIASVPVDEHRRFVDWFRAREGARWDEQMDRDSAVGKLDVLFQVANDESADNWPPST